MQDCFTIMSNKYLVNLIDDWLEEIHACRYKKKSPDLQKT